MPRGVRVGSARRVDPATDRILVWRTVQDWYLAESAGYEPSVAVLSDLLGACLAAWWAWEVVAIAGGSVAAPTCVNS